MASFALLVAYFMACVFHLNKDRQANSALFVVIMLLFNMQIFYLTLLSLEQKKNFKSWYSWRMLQNKITRSCGYVDTEIKKKLNK